MTGEQAPQRTTGTSELSERLARLTAAQVRQGSELDGLNVKVAGIGAWVGGLHSTMSDLSGRLADVTRTVSGLGEEVARSRDEFAAFLQQYERDRLATGAQAELARLTSDWFARFDERKRIRSLARGLVHTLTADAIRRDVVETVIVRECAQGATLRGSSHWLAPATMSLAARYLGDADLRDNARGLAYALDPAKAKLFTALTCARLGEDDDAARWAGRYLETLDPRRLGPEFLPVLSAIAAGELGAEAHTFALQAMLRWDNDPAAPDEGPQEARHISASRPRSLRWEGRLWDVRTPVSADRFPALRQLTADQWEPMAYGWELATVPGGLLAHLSREFPDTPEEFAAGRGYAGIALDSLIDRLEPDEDELHREMEWQRRVVESRGEPPASVVPPALDVPPPGLCFSDVLDHAVFEAARVELGAAARRLALICVWKSVQHAAGDFVIAAAAQRPPHILLSLDGWTADVPTDPAIQVDEPFLADSLATYVEERTLLSFRAITHSPLRLLAAGLGGALTTTLAALLLRGTPAISVGLAGGALLLWGLLDLRRVPVLRRRCLEQGARAKKEGLRLLAAALRQRTEFFDTWDRNSSELTGLRVWSPFGTGSESVPTTLVYDDDDETGPSGV
jgi:hypothetical protein